MSSKTKIIICWLVTGWVVMKPMLWAQSPSQNAAAKALFAEGRNLWDEGKFADAERKFREALTRFPRAEQSDRTAFYFITTLMKLGRNGEARNEIENFYRNYPQSSWTSDVEERRLTLSGLPGPLMFRAQGEPGYHFGEAVQLGPNGEPPSASPFYARSVRSPSLDQEILRLIIERDADQGIEAARARLKRNSSDPAVVANLGTIAISHSTQVVPFLATIASNPASSPHVRSQAVFWMGRHQADRDAVSKALIEMLKENDSARIASDAIGGLSGTDRRAMLDQIARNQNLDRISMLERIYRNGKNSQVRTEVIQTVGSIPDTAATIFLGDVLREENNPALRRAVTQALASRKDVDVKLLLDILNSMQSGAAR